MFYDRRWRCLPGTLHWGEAGGSVGLLLVQKILLHPKRDDRYTQKFLFPLNSSLIF